MQFVPIVLTLLIWTGVWYPAAALAEDAAARTPAPLFSHLGGFYLSPFNLVLSIETAGAEIFYTLDGSLPDRQSLRYAEPIRVAAGVIGTSHTPLKIREGVLPRFPLSYIDTNPPDTKDYFRWHQPKGELFRGTVIRAQAYHPDTGYSPVVTRTFFVDPYMNTRYTLPVVALTVIPEDLFDYDRGIYIPGRWYWENGYGDDWWGRPYANYHQRGREWERPAYLEFYEADGTLGFAQDLGIRIHGGGSRAAPQKALRIYARNEYSEEHNAIRYDVFPGLTATGSGEAIDRFKRLILRNGGQGFFENQFGDAMAQSLIAHTALDTQAYRPVILFINGEYWGLQDFRERMDSRYLESHYGVDRDEVAILYNNGELSHGSPSDAAHYHLMLDYIRDHDITQSEHYAYIKTQMDVDNYIEYVLFQIFTANYDWPGNNIQFWRVKAEYDPEAPYYRDGRWRWMVFDMDYTFGVNDFSDDYFKHATQTGGPDWPNPDWSTFLFRSLIQNMEFRNAFVNAFSDALNTYLQPHLIIERIDAMEQVLLPEMEAHIRRWNRYPAPSVSEWRTKVEAMRSFARRRPEVVWRQMGEFFGLRAPVLLTVEVSDPQAGRVQVNSVIIDADTLGIEAAAYPWRGQYYRSLPVALTALPGPGYVFAGWEGAAAGQDAETVITLSRAGTVTARFLSKSEAERLSLSSVPPQPAGLPPLLRAALLLLLLVNGMLLFAYWKRRCVKR